MPATTIASTFVNQKTVRLTRIANFDEPVGYDELKRKIDDLFRLETSLSVVATY